MPELPEVETIARQLNVVLPGKVFRSVRVLRAKSAQTDLNALPGARIARVFRRGKMVVMELGFPALNGEYQYLLTHLKMTGQLIFQQLGLIDDHTDAFDNPNGRIVGGHPSLDWIQDLPGKHTRIDIAFEDGSKLFFNDLRVFGWMRLTTSEEYWAIDHALPPDVTDREFTVEYLTQILGRSRRPIKTVVMDSQLLGGVGNIYANDALFLAKIDPRKAAAKVRLIDVTKLYEAIRTVIERGISLGGASEKDYVHIDGLGGHYQDHFLVYKQAGKRCPNDCEGTIEKIKVGGRGTYYCPSCQH